MGQMETRPHLHLARKIRARYTIACAGLPGNDIRGCRQVVRPQLPKLVSAGSNPVTRSIGAAGPVPRWYRVFLLSSAGNARLTPLPCEDCVALCAGPRLVEPLA